MNADKSFLKVEGAMTLLQNKSGSIIIACALSLEIFYNTDPIMLKGQ